jgi:hypothetical protein
VIHVLLRIRVSRAQLAIVAALSALATALVITAAAGRTAAQSAALAALRGRPVAVRVAAATPATAAASATLAFAPAGVGSPPPGRVAPTPTAAAGSSTDTAAATQTASNTTPSSTHASAVATKPKIAHVFVIALSTTSFDAAFGHGSVAHYLNGTLKRQGTLLGGYESLGRTELPDYLAMISGQAPNLDTRGGCATYAEFASGAKPAADGQVPGPGCVYPNTVLTIGDQATAAGDKWKAYLEDMGRSTCVHPNSNAVDGAPPPGAGAQYASRHNPFIYFHSLLDLGGCASDDVSLDRLPGDLRSEARTPRYAFIAPGACEDASAQTCARGRPVGLAAEDGFLRRWVPQILRSPAYKLGGVLMLAFAPSTGNSQATVPGPDTLVPTGALVLSQFTPRGQTISAPFNPYSLLRSIDDLLGYKPLALARTARSFVSKVVRGG